MISPFSELQQEFSPPQDAFSQNPTLFFPSPASVPPPQEHSANKMLSTETTNIRWNFTDFLLDVPAPGH